MNVFKSMIKVMVVLVLTSAIYSCSKLEETEAIHSKAQSVQSTDDHLLEQKINTFLGKMNYLRENNTYKSSEFIGLDSTVWYLEAASNKTYGSARYDSEKFIADTFSIVIDAENGQVLMSDIVIAYDEMIQNLSTAYAIIPEDTKHLLVNDVTLRYADDLNATLGVNAVFGAGTAGTNSNFNYAWYWGLLMGREDGAYAGISDAAEEIEKMIHQRKGILPPNSYYTDIDSLYVDGEMFFNPNDPIPNDNMYDFMLFYNVVNEIMPNDHDLLSVEEMNFYLFSTEYVVKTYEPDGLRPLGKSFISLNLEGDMLLTPNESLRMHFGHVKYGDLHFNSKPPSKL